MTEDPFIQEDAAPEALSILEALDEIAGTVETIVLSFGGEQERDAYFALADEYGSYADSLLEETAQRDPEQDARLMELDKRMETALNAIVQACPGHIRKLHEAVPAAVDAEEALKV